jgi:hypothetical protein
MNAQIHHPNYVATMRTLAPLLRQHPPLAALKFESLCDWVAYYWNHGTISFVINEAGEPEAVALVKLFRSIGQFLDPFIHDPCGRFCMIELMVASEPISMGRICEELTNRWGPQAVMLWDRGLRTEKGCPRMYRWNQFMKLARRLSYGIVI